MVTERFIFEFKSSGVRAVKRDLDQAARSAGTAARNTNLLKRALLGFGAFTVLRGVAALADSYQNLSNRVRVVTSSTSEFNAAQAEVFRIANETRTSVRGVADTYSRVSLSVKELGESNRSALDITETLNKAVIIGGSSSIEAEKGIVQLAQGLSSGALRGDELRSVLEQLPVVADVIAKQLGVTRGALREMGAQGKISAEDITEAFKNSREEIAERFARLPPTIGQAFTVLRNNLVNLFGDIDKATGVISAFSKALILVSNNLASISKIALIVGANILFFRNQALLTSIALKGLTVVTTAYNAALFLLSHTYVQLRTDASGFLKEIGKLSISPAILLSMAAAAFLFRDSIVLSQKSMVTLGDVTRAAGGSIRDIFSGLFGDTKEGFDDMKKDGEGAVFFLLRGFGKLIDFASGTLTSFFTIIRITFTRVFDSLLVAFQGIVNKIIEGVNLLADGLESITGIDLSIDPASFADEAKLRLAGGNFGQALLDGIEASFANNTTFQDNIEKSILLLENRAAARLSGDLDQDRTPSGRQSAGDQIITARIKKLQEETKALNSSKQVQEGLRVVRELESKARQKLTVQQKASIFNTIREKAAIEELAGVRENFESLVADLTQENMLLKLNTQEREIQAQVLSVTEGTTLSLTDAQTEALRVLIEQNQALERNNELNELATSVRERLVPNVQSLIAQQAELNRLYQEGAINLNTFGVENARLEKQFASGNSFGDGLTRGLATVKEQILDVGSTVESALVGAFNRASDALAEFATTGQADFRALTESILKDLSRLLIQQALAGIIGASTGGGRPPGIEGPLLESGSFFGRQAGGPVQAGRAVIVGEKRPELFVPTQSGNILPEVPQASPPNITVVNVSDPKEIQANIAAGESDEALINFVQRNSRSIKKMLR